MNTFAAVLWKDLVTEWRTRDRAVAMLVFSLLTVLVLRFSHPMGALANTDEIAPGLLWVAYTFSSVIGLNRAFATELENDALSGLALAPSDRGWIFAGKALANLLILSGVQFATAVFFGLLFDIDFTPVAGRLALVAGLGAVGLSSVGTLFAAIAVRTRYREVMLPLLLLPLLIPILLSAVRATAVLLESGVLPDGPIRTLLVIDAVFAILSFITFEYVLDE